MRGAKRLTQREADRLLDLLAKLSEQDEVDGEMRDEISHIRDLLWEWQ